MQHLSHDPRNIAIFLAMLISLIASQIVHLSAWIQGMPGNTKAKSRIRRLSRWLNNSSINPHEWYAPIFGYAMREWTKMPIFLALDTSMLYDRFCCIQISMIYMNRAIPVAWRVLEHNSSSVEYKQYADLLGQVKALLPLEAEIIFLADRGFVCKALMRQLQQLGWTWRMRIKKPKIADQKWFYHAEDASTLARQSAFVSREHGFRKRS